MLEEWVKSAQEGNTEAYGRIVTEFQDMAYYTALGYLGERQLAQDAAQDAFIEAYRCLPTLKEPLAFAAWLRRIVFKHCDRQTRGQQPLQLEDDIWLRLVEETPSPDHMLEQVQKVQAVRTVIQSLPEIYCEVTELFYLNGRSLQEISTQFDLPISTVKKRLYTARQLLKERIDPMTKSDYRPSQDDNFSNHVRFHLALKNSDLLQVRQLARRDPDLLTKLTEWDVAVGGWYWPLGSSALHWAVSIGDVALTSLLVEVGADVNYPDRGENTPLKRAVHMGQMETARWLLDNGADPNLVASNGQTALHTAVIHNWPEMIDLLLANEADAAVADSQKRTPLDWAIIKGLPELAQKLDAPEDVTWPEPVVPTKTTTMWETGIKLLDLMAPLKWERDFSAESRMLQWRNYGVESFVELFYGDEKESDKKQSHLAHQGVKRVKELAKKRPVLLIVYTSLALSDGVMPILEEVNDLPNVTLLYAGIETIGAEPPPLMNLDAAFTFNYDRAIQGWWPAIDPVRSYSTAFENEAHKALATTAVRLCRRYQDLHIIYKNQGIAGFDLAIYGDAERDAVQRSRALQQFFNQPLVIAETWSATPGEYIPLSETLANALEILEGGEQFWLKQQSMAGQWNAVYT